MDEFLKVRLPRGALPFVISRLNSVKTRLARRSVFSPVDGTVQEVYYRPGEMVPAGRPVVALLPPIVTWPMLV